MTALQSALSLNLPVVSPEPMDGLLMRIVPWLASRYDFMDGSFSGRDEEARVPAGILTAQAAAILQAAGLYLMLPYAVRIKFDAWPALPPGELSAPSRRTPLVETTRGGLNLGTDAFLQSLEPFVSCDGGFTLRAHTGGAGMMAAAYHLMVEARPAWYAKRGRSITAPERSPAEKLVCRFLPTFGL